MRILNFVLLGAALLYSNHALSVTPGSALPVINVKGSVDGHLTNEIMQGKVTIINFWATWCDACKVELKEMEQAFNALTSNESFQFAMVALDRDPKNARRWIKENLAAGNAALQQLFEDPEFNAARAVGVDSFPMTLIVGPDLRVLHIQRGYKQGDGSTQIIARLAQEALTQL